jgi:3-hydroxybutyryl-CoA dehydrogenase
MEVHGMSQKIRSVAVLGGGFMGAGIAESAAVAGVPVVIRELPELTAVVRARLEKSLDIAASRGKLDVGEKESIMARITISGELKDVAGCDLVIEALPEDLALKTAMMRELNELVSHETILASNTSSIPIAKLGGAVSNPARVLGLHFFSPVPAMKLVEIVRALDSSDETVDAAKDFGKRVGSVTKESLCT